MKISASYHQERLWFIDRFETGYLYESSPIYHNIPLIIRISGDVDVRSLEMSIRQVISRHESLRTRIYVEEDILVQEVRKDVDFYLEVTDLAMDREEKAGDEALALAREEAGVPFAIDTDLLIRGKIFRAGKREFVLVIVLHHIIADRYSVRILVEEMFHFYQKFLDKVPHTLPDLPIHYVDFSKWQRDLPPKLNDYLLAYWKEKLKGKLQALELPTDRPRALVHTYRNAEQHFTLPEDTGKEIISFSKAQGIDHFITLLGVFIVLFFKYSGSEEIVVGTSAENRKQAYTSGVIGPIANLLVIRSFIAKHDSFAAFIPQLKKTVQEANEYQGMPFDKLVAELNPDKDMGRTALFDVFFQYEENPMKMPRVGNLDIEIIETNLGWGKYDFNILVRKWEDCFIGIFVYNGDYYKDSTISRLIDHYRKLLKSILKDPGLPISKLSLLTGREKNRILVEFNSTAARYPEDTTIHELFEEQANRTPWHTALVLGNDQMSYRELNRRANQLAGLLTERGAKPDTIVGILLEKSFGMIAGILGILKSGGAYLPVDPGYPEERITYLIQNSGCTILLTLQDYVKNMVIKCRIVSVSDAGPTVERNREVRETIEPSNLAYIIYTSGTTGRPKGSLIEHRNVVRLMFNDNYLFDFNSSDIWTLFHSICFDFSVWEMYGALLYGGKLIVIPRRMSRDTEKFLNLLRSEKVTVLNQTPTAFYNLATLEASSGEKSLNTRYIIFGGDSLSPAKLKTWKHKYPAVKLINMYGITETTVHVTYKEISDEEIESNRSIIGKPIPTLTVYVMDENQELLPIGITGELYVGGEGVCRGYLGLPGLTSERFIDNPHRKGEKLYRSGDLARLLDDGEYEYMGRSDDQVKVRGFRIELGEIEKQLLTHEGIREAVVISGEDKNGDRHLIAYIVKDSETESEQMLNTEILREHLSRKLPVYMIPSFFVEIESLPLTGNGKIDKKMLPEPGEAGSIGQANAAEYTSPRNELEERLIEIWEEVLGRKNISIKDNFFMIGGDSIKTIQIASRLRKIGFTVEMSDIFSHPTISELSPWVKKIERIADQSVITGEVPLTPIQREFFSREKKVPHHFNQAVILFAKEGFEKNGVVAVLEKILQHHDALRITFTREGNKIIQINNGHEHPVSLQVHDFRGKENALSLMREKVNEIQSGIDLEKGPLMKSGLFKSDDGDRLLIVIHHLVIDGVSWRILFEDIDTLFRQYKDGKKLDLPLKSDSFKSWSGRLKGYADSRSLLKEKEYWARLEAVEVKLLAAGNSGCEVGNYGDVDTYSFMLSEEETERLLTKVNKTFGTEINDILMTALGLALKDTFGHETFLVALEGHGREDILKGMDISRTIGWFTSIFPVILDMSYEGNLARQIKEIKETLHQVPNKGTGYGILKYLTSGENKIDIEFKAQPRILFNYLGQFEADIVQRCFTINRDRDLLGVSINGKNRRDYELEIGGINTGKELALSLSYGKRQYKPTVVKALMANYKTRLRQIISFCSGRQKRELTPSDLTYKKISIDYLDKLSSLYLIEDIYKLSPMQEGILVNDLYNSNSISYYIRISYRLRGTLNIEKIHKSLSEIMKCYDILRAVVVHEGLEQPVQVILKEREIGFIFEDIRKLTDTVSREKYIREFKLRDKELSFNLQKEVLIRIAILQLDDKEYEFIWSNHHILLDGWSTNVLIKNFFLIYNSYLEGKPCRLPAIKPYREYIEWLEVRDKEASRQYWRDYLSGYEETARFPQKAPDRLQGLAYKDEQFVALVDNEKSIALDKMAGSNNVTLNTIIQAVLAILLGKYTGKEDVVFGAVVSGRPSEIEDVESMIGLFINTVPVRIKPEEKMSFAELLQKIQESAVKSEKHHYCPLAEIQTGSNLKQDLFKHVIAFENFPTAENLQGIENPLDHIIKSTGFELIKVDTFEQGYYDLNFLVGLKNRLFLKFYFNSNIYPEEFIKRLSENYIEILEQVIGDPGITLADIKLSHDKAVAKSTILDIDRGWV